MRMIPHSCPTISLDDIQSVTKVLRSGQVSAGPAVKQFEQAFAHKFNMPHTAAVSSGTAAIHLSLLALDVGPGDEVILPTHVCSALLNAIHYVQARPVLVDVNEADANISVAEVKKRMSSRTKAVLVPHMYGIPADLKGLLKLGLPLIEDCAQSIGAVYDGRPVGSFGRINAFSFYATKMMTSGEGGLVATKDRKLMLKVRDLLSYDHKADQQVRFNYKLTDLQAAMAGQQLKKLDRFVERRRAIARMYMQVFPQAGSLLEKEMAKRYFSCYRYVVRVRNSQRFIQKAKAKGIMCERPLFKPLHCYLGLSGFPVSDKLYQQSVSIPIYPSLKDMDVKRIIKELKDLFDK